MYCQDCGAINNESATHCIECGRVLRQDTYPYPSQRGLTGSHISLFASLIALFMFFMPWVTVCGLTMSGLQLAMGGMGELQKGFSSMILFVVPLVAFVIAWITFTKIRNHRSKPSKGAIWRILLSIIGALPLVVAYQIKENIRPLLSWGFFGTVASFFLSAIGGLFDWFDSGDD